MDKCYSLGFCFSKNLEYILLIEKNTKKIDLKWMNNKLNGIGGEVKEGESADEAMVREFKEETNLLINNWKCFGTFDVIKGKGTVHLYVAKSDAIFQAKSITKEKVRLCWLDKMKFTEFMSYKEALSNLKFLIPMAINAINDEDSCKFFTIQENK